jgi:copper chaperone CopZ
LISVIQADAGARLASFEIKARALRQIEQAPGRQIVVLLISYKGKTMQTEVLNVTGMTSEDCTETVMRTIKSIDGVSNVSVSYPQNRAIVQFDEDQTAPAEMANALVKAGFGVRKINLGEQDSSCGGCCGKCGG